MTLLRSLILTSATASLALAQPPVDTSRLAPVVVTASRTGTAQNVATAATTVLDGDALRARGIATLGAALREVPGATVAQTSGSGSQTSLFLRGGNADYVQVMIDGVTINEPGGAFNFANITLDNVERIEIVRGPASVLYGANAVTGVIQIFTRGAAEGASGDLRLSAGQRGLVDAEASAGQTFGNVGIWIGGGHHRSDGIYALNNQAERSAGSARLRFAPVAAAVVNVTARYADATYDYPTEYWGAPLDSNSSNVERRLSTGLDLLWALRPAIDLRLVVGMSRFQNITSDPIDNRAGEIGDDGSPVAFETRSLRRNADLQADFRVTPAATFTLGTEFDWQRLHSEGDDPTIDPLLERWSRGAYTQLAGNAGMRFSYTAGGRVEDNERFGRLGNARVGAGVELTPTTSVRGAAGTAFKEPQFFEVTGAGFALPNPTLRPERSRSWELGIEQRLAGDRVALGATYFDQAFSDMILFASIPASGGYTSQYINAQSATSRGVEVEARAAVAGRFSARANVVSLIDAGYHATASTASAALPRRASRTGSMVVSIPATSRLLLTADASYVGPRPDVRYFPVDPWSVAEELPSYTLVGLSGSYALRGLRDALGVELMARVDNLLDERYEAVAGFATPRRTVSVGVRFEAGR